MSDVNSPSKHQSQADGPEQCMPCRGTGRIISHQGGGESIVSCPWCRGSGMRIPDLDAQSREATDSTGG